MGDFSRKAESIIITNIDSHQPSGLRGECGSISCIVKYIEEKREPDPEWEKFKKEYCNLSDSESNSESDSESDSESEEENIEEYSLVNNTKAENIKHKFVKNENGGIDMTNIENIRVALKYNRNCKTFHKLEDTKFYRQLEDKYKFSIKNTDQDILNKLREGEIDVEHYLYILFGCDVCFKGKKYLIFLEYLDYDTYNKYFNGEINDCEKKIKLNGEQEFNFDPSPSCGFRMTTKMINRKIYEYWCNGHGWLNRRLPLQIIASKNKKKYCFESLEYDNIEPGEYLEGECEWPLYKHDDIFKSIGWPTSDNFNYREFNRVFKEKCQELDDQGYECINGKSNIVVF